MRHKDETLINNIIEKLKKIGQINDEEFAKWYIEQRQTFRPKGQRAIEFELLRKGVKFKVPLQGKQSSISQEELAKRALLKLRGEKTKERQQRFLLSRGFDWQTIEEVVE